MRKLAIALLTSLSLYAIEGTYSIKGIDPYSKSPYTGTAVITKDINGVYQIASAYEMNDKQYHDGGTGLKIGDTVSFVFKSIQEEGVQVYKIGKNKLEGPFVMLGNNLVGMETLEKQ